MPTGSKPRPPENAIRVSLEGIYSTTKWANILWLNSAVSGNPTSTELQAVMTVIGDSWGTHIAPLLVSAVTLQEVKGVWFGASDTEVVGNVEFDSSGSAEGDGCTAQVAVCLSWEISAYYRGGKPRTYLPGIPQGALANEAYIATDNAAAFQTAGADFISDINAVDSSPFESIALGTFSFASGNEWRVTPLFRAYEGCSCHTRLDTQRRRLGKELS